MTDAYAQLLAEMRRADAIGRAMSALDWDRAVTMPPAGAEQRADEIATLAVLRHDIMASAHVGDLLDQAVQDDMQDADMWRRANIRKIRHARAHAMAMDASLLAAIKRQASVTETAWYAARKANDFAALAPHLKDMVALSRECAAAKGDALGLAPYDAMLDSYDEGMRQSVIDPVFAVLRQELPPMIDHVIARQNAQPPLLPLQGPFAPDAQMEAAWRMADMMGYTRTHGRIDVSAHPFSTGQGGDVRITTRFDTDDALSSLMAIAHEIGHAIYNRNLPAAHAHDPAGNSGLMGMSMHESQSLIIEMQLCRSRPFMDALAPIMRDVFGTQAGFAPDNLHRHAAHVSRSLIRVEADEMTYPLHVILRYGIEKDLLAGLLDVADLPAVWNDGMQRLLGVTPPSDALGCMQDVHWHAGYFGYFPLYALGALNAAAFMKVARRALPSLDTDVSAARLSPFLDWLRITVHEKANLHTPLETARIVTGHDLSPEPYLAHLKARYMEAA